MPSDAIDLRPFIQALAAAIAEELLRRMPHPQPVATSAGLANPRQLYTFAEAAKLLRVSTRTVHRYIAVGLLRSVTPAGGRPRISEAELTRFTSQDPYADAVKPKRRHGRP